MKMKKGLLLIIAVLMFSLLLSACATPTVDDVLGEATEEPAAEVTEEPTEEPTAEPTEEPTAEPTEEATEEPTAEPTEEMASTTALDENVAAFLSGLEGYNVTTPADVSEMQVEGTEFFLLDVRGASELEENGYIEGAVNIPLKELAQNVDKLPSLDTPIVVYCAAGTRAAIGMVALGEMGFTDVKSMQGGSFGGWVEAGYPVAEGVPEAPVLDEANVDADVVAAVDAMLQSYPDGWAQLAAEDLNSELVDGAELTLIDVRRPEELAEKGQIEGAVNIPLEQFMEMQAEWPSTDADIVIYCAAGYRGNLAMAIMRAYGYENIRNLKGGFGAWSEAGLPVVEGSGTAAGLDANVAAFLDGLEGYNVTTPADVSEMQVEGTEFFLLDVRGASELEENGYIEGAVNIPLKELAQNVDKLPSLDTPIVVYCAAGTRAAIGMVALGEMGFTDVKSMQGGSFGGWVEAGYPVAEGVPEAPVLDEANVDADVVAAVDAMLQSYPDGWAQLAAEDLNSELIDGAELTLIDVRREEELAENGYIEGAVNIPLEQLIEMQAEWPSTDADIVIYCAAGYRGNLAMAIMRAYGYENIRNLKGGFGAWSEAGLPVVTD